MDHVADDFSLVLGGPLHRLYLRTHLARAPLDLLHRRIIAAVLMTWVPLWVLTAIDGHASSGAAIPLLFDLDAHARLLVALPLLVGAEPIVHRRISAIVQQFTESGLIAPEDLPRFDAAVASSMRLRNSAALEVFVLLVAFVAGQWLWMAHTSLRVPMWYGAHGADGIVHLTVAGGWYALVSLPLFRFLVLRWFFRMSVWYRFLWLVSRIPLRLNSLHPDRTGGLGFLGHGILAFAPVLLAQTILFSAVVAGRIWREGATLPQFQLDILAIVACLMMIVMLPNAFFAMQLERAWHAGLREFGDLGSRYVEGFRQKWIAGDRPASESLVGSADIQSLADLANSFEVVRSMRLLPLGKSTVLRLAIVVVLPLLPLTLTMIPLSEMIERAIKIFV